jgi:hypothetical protein
VTDVVKDYQKRKMNRFGKSAINIFIMTRCKSREGMIF